MAESQSADEKKLFWKLRALWKTCLEATCRQTVKKCKWDNFWARLAWRAEWSHLLRSNLSPWGKCQRSVNYIFWNQIAGVTSWHTSYLSFFYTNTFWGLEILLSKVRKFATKICSRQNSVNYTLCVKLHTVCKIYTLCVSLYTVCKITHCV